MIYISYFILSAIFCFLIKQDTVDKRTLSLLLMLSLTFLFVAFSYPAGFDWISYFSNYDCLVNGVCYSNFTLFEPGYQFIVKTVGQLGYLAITTFIAFVNTVLLYKFAKNFNHSALIILMITCTFLWGMFTEAIRQGITFCIISYGILFLYKGNIYKYLMTVLIASLFHVTAVISIIFILPYLSKKISKIAVFALFIVGIAFFIFPTQILSFILPFLPENSNTGIKLDFYLNSETYKPQLSVGLGLIIDIILLIAIFVSNKRIRKDRLYSEYKFYLVTLLGAGLYITFSILIGRIMPVLTRIGWYGFPMVIMLLYINIGKSKFYDAYNFKLKIDPVVILIIIYFLIQPLRPFFYGHSNYAILHQQTIIQKSSELDDKSLLRNSNQSCSILSELGYGYLCI